MNMDRIGVETALTDTCAALERSLVILDVAIAKAMNVRRWARDGVPTEDEALALNYACCVDLQKAEVMLDAVADMLHGAFESSKDVLAWVEGRSV